MDIIKTGIEITKTIRNVQRLKEIVLVFARHGFDEFISLGVTSKIPNFVLPRSKRGIKKELEEEKEKDWYQVIGHRLRLCFEELGPAFIKFGQLLSSREDLFDPSFVKEMRPLRDKVRPIPFESIKESIEQSLGKSIDEIFQEIEPEPIGTASIGVVFKGQLKNGEDVVIKVRRPGIEKEIQTDFAILSFIVSQMERVSEEIKYLGLSRVINDFAVGLQSELNFNIEALNCERLTDNIKKHDTKKLFHLPKVYKDYTRENILVLERLKGIPFSENDRIISQKEDLSPKVEQGMRIFIKTFLQDGFFHADLHGGNFFYLDNKKIGLIDFGLMGTLSKKGRKNFIAILYAIITHNHENLVYEFLDVADYESIPDIDKLISDVRTTLAPYVGLTVQQVDFTQVFQSILATLRTHRIYLPREWFIVFRALMTLDGVGRDLQIDLDLFKILNEDLQGIITETISKDELIEEAIWLGRDALSSARVLPRHLKWFVREWAKKGYAFEVIHRGHEEEARGVINSIVFLGLMLLTSVFVISGVLSMGNKNVVHWQEISLLSWIFWSLAGLSLFRAYTLMRKL